MTRLDLGQLTTNLPPRDLFHAGAARESQAAAAPSFRDTLEQAGRGEPSRRDEPSREATRRQPEEREAAGNLPTDTRASDAPSDDDASVDGRDETEVQAGDERPETSARETEPEKSSETSDDDAESQASAENVAGARSDDRAQAADARLVGESNLPDEVSNDEETLAHEESESSEVDKDTAGRERPRRVQSNKDQNSQEAEPRVVDDADRAGESLPAEAETMVGEADGGDEASGQRGRQRSIETQSSEKVKQVASVEPTKSSAEESAIVGKTETGAEDAGDNHASGGESQQDESTRPRSSHRGRSRAGAQAASVGSQENPIEGQATATTVSREMPFSQTPDTAGDKRLDGARPDSNETSNPTVSKTAAGQKAGQAPSTGESVGGTTDKQLPKIEPLLAAKPGEPRGTEQALRARFIQRVAGAVRLASQRGGQLRLRLSPPELGSLRLEIAVRQGALEANIKAETTAARSLLMESLPVLRERLASQGIKIERFDVDLMDDFAGDSPAPQDDRGLSDRGNGRDGAVPRHAQLRDAPTETEVATTPETTNAKGDGRLNVII